MRQLNPILGAEISKFAVMWLFCHAAHQAFGGLMKSFSRRSFVNFCAASPFLAAWDKSAAALYRNTAPSGNIFLAWNDIHGPENGESDEYTTIENIVRMVRDWGIPNGRRLIGIGARSGTPDATFEMPGEMGYSWLLGSPWEGLISNPTGGPALGLGMSDPIPVTQVGILDDHTAHRFTLDGSSMAGQVLWSFYNDDTFNERTHKGFRNLFSDVDAGLADTLFQAANLAKASPGNWATNAWRQKLARFMPNLASDEYWRAFVATLHSSILERDWLPYIRSQNWQGAAVVLRGSMMNVGQFYFKEWNRRAPSEPNFKVGAGMHGPLHMQYGREMVPVMRNEDSDWSMVGFIFDTERNPDLVKWRRASDIFGQPYHIHGFRADGKHGGHTLMSTMGTGNLELSLYPLNFTSGESSYFFDADLRVVTSSLEQLSTSLSIQIENVGANFARNVTVKLENILTNRKEEVVIPMMRGGERATARFTGTIAKDQSARRRVTADPRHNFIETTAAQRNNVFTF
jgi:hypothetical protein